jgi:hypothetical protein
MLQVRQGWIGAPAHRGLRVGSSIAVSWWWEVAGIGRMVRCGSPRRIARPGRWLSRSQRNRMPIDVQRGLDAAGAGCGHGLVLLRRRPIRVKRLVFLRSGRVFGLGPRRSPKKSVLHQTISAIRPETWEAINRAVLASAKQDKLESGAAVRIDSTVTAALIHEPSDSALLWDAVRPRFPGLFFGSMRAASTVSATSPKHRLPLTAFEPTTAAQPSLREPLFMPLGGPRHTSDAICPFNRNDSASSFQFFGLNS